MNPSAFRSSVLLALLCTSGAAAASTTAAYDDGEVFVDYSADDVLACDGTTSIEIDLSGISPQGVDLIFILDASGSVGSAGWAETKAAVGDAIDTLADEIDSGDLRIGIIRFSSTVQSLYDFSDTQDSTTIANFVNSINYTGGQTYTETAMSRAITDFATYGDDDRAKRIILVTDGVPLPTSQNPCDGTSSVPGDLASYDIQTRILGVGTGWDPTILECLVDDPADDIFEVDDFTDLDLAAAVEPPPAGTDGVFAITVGGDFALNSATESEGSVTVAGNDVEWYVSAIDELGSTLTLSVTHAGSDRLGGSLDLLLDGQLDFIDLDGVSRSEALADLSITVSACDDDGDSYAADVDCNDADASIYPGAPEVCADQGTDNDCDGDSAEASDEATWYADADTDGYGNPASSTLACTQPSGFVANDDDCDDSDAALNEDDADADGFSTCEGDCNDGDALINPSATEFCDDFDVDEDCDGTSDNDDADAAGQVTWYADVDGDGWGDGSDSVSQCDASGVYTEDSDGDCDDTAAGVNPDALEVCDDLDVDENCNGLADDDDSTVDSDSLLPWWSDADGDLAGDPADQLQACEQPAGYVDNDNDECPTEDATGNDDDFDGCIDDSDGDGIDDDEDQCVDSDTTLGSGIDATGCTVADYCPCDGPSDLDAPISGGGWTTTADGYWKSEGNYRACVTQVSKSFQDDGFISSSDRKAATDASKDSFCAPE